MPNDNRFKASIVATLAKRAANMCSNPDCRASTSGPTKEPEGSSNLGEAAHIFGANPGSARYDPNMTSAERSAISNAIWLCGNCHKMVDDDPTHYPSGLLFEWLHEHERYAKSILGKTGGEIRRRYEDRHLEEFGKLSFMAERLIREKGRAWEYRLTAEVLRYEMRPIVERWHALRAGHYTKAYVRIPKEESFDWINAKNSEIRGITTAFEGLVNDEFARAWGADGEPGDDRIIVTTCRLFAEACKRALEWEESVRFVRVDEIFEEIVELYFGVAGPMIDEATKLASFLSEGVEEAVQKLEEEDEVESDDDEDREPLVYRHTMSITLPDEWADKMCAALERVEERYHSQLPY